MDVTFGADAVPQCSSLTVSWTNGQPPQPLQFFYQNNTSAWNTTGQVYDVYGSPFQYTVNVPADLTVFATLVDNNGNYGQTRRGALVLPSNDASCIDARFFGAMPDLSTTTVLTEVTRIQAITTTVYQHAPTTVYQPTTETLRITETLSNTAMDVGSMPTSAARDIAASSSLADPIQSPTAVALDKSLAGILGGVFGVLFLLALLCCVFLLIALRKARRQAKTRGALLPVLRRSLSDSPSLRSVASRETTYTISEVRSMRQVSDSNTSIQMPVSPATSEFQVSRSPTVLSRIKNAGRRSSLPPVSPTAYQVRPVSELFFLDDSQTVTGEGQDNEDRRPSLTRTGTAETYQQVQGRNLFVSNKTDNDQASFSTAGS